MTLVVCRKESDELYVHSDSKVIDTFGTVSERNLRQNAPLSGLLKTVILHPHICLSFAGNSGFATEFLKRFFSEELKSWNTPRLVEELEQVHRDSAQECEFILCEVIARSPRITVIKDGNVTHDATSAWIGSQPAFAAYQAAFHSLESTRPVNERMREAFRAVIDDEQLSEVGHFHIELYLEHHFADTGLIGGGADSVFVYEVKSEWDTGSQIFHIEANVKTALPLGSATYGAYGVSYFRSLSTKRHGVAIHFPYANKGILMCPQLDCERPLLYPDCSAEDLLELIWKDHKVPLEGVAVVSDTQFRHIRTTTQDEVHSDI
jgi:hypothetical protein